MDSVFRHIHPLDSLEAEQELDLVDGRVGGHLLQDRPEGLLNILAERDALDDEAGQVHGHSLVRLKHEMHVTRFVPLSGSFRHILAPAEPFVEPLPKSVEATYELDPEISDRTPAPCRQTTRRTPVLHPG